MKITKLYLFVNLFVIATNIVMISGNSFASNSDADFVYIDGRKYPKQKIIDDFINVAFSDFDLNDDADEDDRIALKNGYHPMNILQIIQNTHRRNGCKNIRG